MADSAVVSAVDTGRDDYGFFSPDGRYLRFFDQSAGIPGSRSEEPFLYDVACSQRAPLPRGRDLGWTPQGDVLSLGKDGTVRENQLRADVRTVRVRSR
jgi:hypothetical protein